MFLLIIMSNTRIQYLIQYQMSLVWQPGLVSLMCLRSTNIRLLGCSFSTKNTFFKVESNSSWKTKICIIFRCYNSYLNKTIFLKLANNKNLIMKLNRKQKIMWKKSWTILWFDRHFRTKCRFQIFIYFVI